LIEIYAPRKHTLSLRGCAHLSLEAGAEAPRRVRCCGGCVQQQRQHLALAMNRGEWRRAILPADQQLAAAASAAAGAEGDQDRC
jgi:hypothetical protein